MPSLGEWGLLLACAGVASSLGWWAYRRRSRYRRLPAACSVLLLVKDQALIIEGFMREVCSLVGRRHGLISDVTVVDAGSSDDTFAILERLARDLPIKVVRWRGEDNPQGSSALDMGYVLCDRPAALLLHLTDENRAARFLALLHRLFAGGGEERGAVRAG